MTRTHALTASGLALSLALALAGCQNDYATDGCSAAAAPPVADFHAGATDVTFLAFGDSQVFLDASLGQDDGGRKNDLHVQALNVVDDPVLGLDWSALGLAEPVASVRGVLMAGDIVQNGRDARSGASDEYGVFVDDYGLCGNRVLRFPMYEGYGNHDYFEFANLLYPDGDHPVADSVSIRNPYRQGVVRTAPGTDGHYSWDWDDVHFVNVNLAPSDVPPASPPRPGVRDPRNALTFLAEDLAAVGPDRRVVIMQHYQPGSATFEWDQAQIAAFAATIAPYRVIAIVHGHLHDTYTNTWNGIPVFNVGSPYYEVPNPSGDGRGHFAVMRITTDRIYAFDASWDPNDPTSLTGPDRWSRVVDLP